MIKGSKLDKHDGTQLHTEIRTEIATNPDKNCLVWGGTKNCWERKKKDFTQTKRNPV